jgi:predicted oxidoreductase
MQADEIAEAVEELKSEGKIIDFDFQTTSSQTELIRQKTEITIKSSFRQLISNRCSTEVLTICKCIVFGPCHGIQVAFSSGKTFRKRTD